MSERVEMLKEILAQNPGDSFARYGLAMEYDKAGDTESALAEFRRLLEANPDYTAAYQMAAQTLMRASRLPEARQMLEAGLACARRTRNQHAQSEMQGMLDELGAE